MYRPAVFSPADDAIAWQIIREHPLGLLLLPDGSLSPLPMLGDESAKTLRGHLARANPASLVPNGTEATVVFLGPHGYVSPTWYGTPAAHVPTWNYVLVQMKGTLRWLDTRETRAVLDDLCARFEAPGGYSPALVDDAQMAEMLEEIVGFRIEVREVQPKLKLSQNRSPEDWERVWRQFAEAPSPGPELAAWMARAGQ